MPDPRALRIAENESRFREINERLQSDLRRLPPSGTPIDFVCECGYADCAASVPLTADEYERVREDSTTFAMLPGHVIPDVEDLVSEHERYVVARKHPETHPLVEETDPRA